MKLTDRERKHLKAVIDYLYSDESKNYEDEGRPKDHIFVSVPGLQEILWRGSGSLAEMNQHNPALAEAILSFDTRKAEERRREKLPE